MARRSRKRQQFVINRRWALGVGVSVFLVATAVVGLVLVQTDTLGQMWAYVFLALGGLGAVSGLLQTIVRSKSGDDLDDSVR